jgi:hypothetical protein
MMIKFPLNYKIMRLFARFKIVREVYSLFHRSRYKEKPSAHQNDPFTVRNECLQRELDEDGYAGGISLDKDVTQEVVYFTQKNPCYAGRNTNQGFYFPEHRQASEALGQNILVAQYFNFSSSDVAKKILRSPSIKSAVYDYFGHEPKMVGTNLWWTFPGDHSEKERVKHAHFFHRDIDDFKFLKLFIYITDVTSSDGPHVIVKKSHKKALVIRLSDLWRERRFTDKEVEGKFADNIEVICGPSGTCFFENTLCLHKGETPQNSPRLVLQIEWALNDYDIANDKRSNLSQLT